MKRKNLIKRGIASLLATVIVLLEGALSVTAIPQDAVDLLDTDTVSANTAYADYIHQANPQIDESRDYSKERIIVVADNGNEFDFSTVAIDKAMTVQEAIEYYEELPGVAFAQPDYVLDTTEEFDYYIDSGEVVAEEEFKNLNDPLATNQWYLKTLQMDMVWDYIKDMPYTKIKVAVVDTGIDANHQDLQKAINPDLCVSSVDERFEKITTDFGKTGHGTHIAGIIGATANNKEGIAGIAADRVEIMAIRCQTETTMYSSYAARGVRYAVDHGARVINMSVGTTKEDSVLKAAVEYAYSHNALVVCSAGNAANDGPHYPSGYNETIGIISLDKDNKRASSSNYGKSNFISAPGRNIYSTLPGGKYGFLSGTSMASGVVSGYAALLLSLEPTMTVDQLKDIMAKTATDIYASGFDNDSGWGAINPFEAVTELCGNVNTINGFVNRLYKIAMGRNADEEGMAYWTDTLQSGEKTGAMAAAGFLQSKEFQNKDLSNEQYVETLYQLFMGRKPDEAGYQYWVSLLENGMSRTYIANEFCTAKEFVQICENCGFQSGRMELTENRDKNGGLTAFVSRQYTKALGREFDVEGLNYWTGEILAGSISVTDMCTTGFFHSKEMQLKNLSDEEYVKVLYRTFFDREYDEGGLNYWLTQLRTGAMTKDQILNSFAISQEFQNVRARYAF